MKVVMHVDGAEIRGNERQALLIAAGLRARGHDVAVSCLPRGPVREAMERAGVRTTGIRPRGDADPVNGLAFVAWLRRERPDAVLLTSWKRFFGASLAARVAGVPRIVFRLGGPQGIPPRGPSAWKYRRAFRRQIDVVVANSPAIRRRVGEIAPFFPADQVHVVLNAVPSVPAAPAPLRAEIGAAADEVVLLGVGTLAPNKRFDLLIDAVATLPSGVRLAIAGDGPVRRELEGQAERLGVAGRVHLLGARDDVPGLMAAADAFVLASRRDSLPNAMLEAMAAGLPTIVADFMGARDALDVQADRPAAGWVVPADQAPPLSAALAEVVEGLRAGAPEVAARAAEARWRAERWFSPERMIDGYEAVLAGGAPGDASLSSS
jgi:glycosyltransferase involved in cell wall biosynthesis